jgi:hypothetical protein
VVLRSRNAASTRLAAAPQGGLRSRTARALARPSAVRGRTGSDFVVRLRDVVIDSVNPPALARFWAEVLDGYAVRAYDAAELARLAERGLTPATDPAVALDGPGPTLFFQRVTEPKSARNRVHLDTIGGDRVTEVARLRTLGATLVRVEADYTVLQDPEGNEFCVLDAR